MKTNVLIVLLILAAALVGGGGYYWMQHNANTNQPDALYGNVDIRSVNLAFRVGGRVQEVTVDEGAQVKAGDVLARLDGKPLQNTLNGNQAALAALSARNALLHKGQRMEDIDQARARVQSAQAALTVAEIELARNRQLVAGGAATRRMLDAAQAQYDQGAAQLKVAQQQLHALNKGFRSEEIAESDALLNQSKASLEVAKLALRDAVLVAPSDGIILTRAVEKGALVAAGTPAFNLALSSPVWVRAYVNEARLGQFGTGTRVLLSTDSRPTRPYHGVVGFVSPTAEFTPKSVETTDLRTALVYRLRVVVNDADSQLRQGMPVTVRLAQ